MNIDSNRDIREDNKTASLVASSEQIEPEPITDFKLDSTLDTKGTEVHESIKI